ncbi:lysophospholipase L1-like esterase [Microbacterium resistens]|uniref:Lysophospholipase L1-like esterase n=1 Tax=Microbacterium resistens TaxID=156977 RepID=A0ABU1SGJ1_9MICO|nr:SGNH/GDSL hydrolase family protein [Microbacterium resistens]MDR6868726.1 lysophospholipase L1-like esterase [Microbacterium resistens]
MPGQTVATVATAMTQADIPGKVATAVTAQDIPGQVAAAVVPGVAAALAADAELGATVAALADGAVDVALADARVVTGGAVAGVSADIAWGDPTDKIPANDKIPADDRFPAATGGTITTKTFPVLDGDGRISEAVLPDSVPTLTDGLLAEDLFPDSVPILDNGKLPASMFTPSDDRPAWASTKGAWDSALSLYNAGPANLLRTRAARAAAAAGDGEWDIAILGDSIHQTGGTPGGRAFVPYSIPTRLARLLRESGFRDGGDGTVTPWDNLTTSGSAWQDQRQKFVPGTGTIELVASGVAGKGARRLTGDAYWQVTVTNADRFLIRGSVAASRSTIVIDPDTSATSLTWAASTDDTGADIPCLPDQPAGMRVGLIEGLTPGPHTIRISGNAEGLVVFGVDARVGNPRPVNNGNPTLTTGVRVHSLARVGVTLAGIASTGLALNGAVRMVRAHTLLIAAGVNDWQGGGRSSYRDALRSILDAQLPIGDAVIVLTPHPNIDPADPDHPAYPLSPAAPGGSYPLAEQMHDAYGIADEYNVPVLDLAALFVDFAHSRAMYPTGDGIHPNDTGRELIARAESRTLLF